MKTEVKKDNLPSLQVDPAGMKKILNLVGDAPVIFCLIPESKPYEEDKFWRDAEAQYYDNVASIVAQSILEESGSEV